MTRLIDADSIPWLVEGVGEIPVITKDEIDQLPTVEVPTVGESVGALPVRHGKWFIGTVPYFVCSECKNRTPLRWDERCGYVLDYRSPYCPNCGARMVEDDQIN